MTVTTVYSILIFFYNTNYYTKYCSKKFLKYSIVCGYIYKAILKKIFFIINYRLSPLVKYLFQGLDCNN